jgi:phage terminase large subunit
MTDKEGNIVNEPQDFMNHAMDAIRYGFDKFQRGRFKMNTDVGGVKPYIIGTLA